MEKSCLIWGILEDDNDCINCQREHENCYFDMEDLKINTPIAYERFFNLRDYIRKNELNSSTIHKMEMLRKEIECLDIDCSNE